jgi:hypothetical protein
MEMVTVILLLEIDRVVAIVANPRSVASIVERTIRLHHHQIPLVEQAVVVVDLVVPVAADRI